MPSAGSDETNLPPFLSMVPSSFEVQDVMTILPPMPSGALTVLAVSLVDGPNQVNDQSLLVSLSAAKAAGIQLAVMTAASRPAVNRRASPRFWGEWLMVFLLLSPAPGAGPWGASENAAHVCFFRQPCRTAASRRKAHCAGCIHPSYSI